MTILFMPGLSRGGLTVRAERGPRHARYLLARVDVSKRGLFVAVVLGGDHGAEALGELGLVPDIFQSEAGDAAQDF